MPEISLAFVQQEDAMTCLVPVIYVQYILLHYQLHTEQILTLHALTP